jgi:hypothetical protein
MRSGLPLDLEGAVNLPPPGSAIPPPTPRRATTLLGVTLPLAISPEQYLLLSLGIRKEENVDA